MKPLLLATALLGCLAFTACESGKSFPTALQQRFHPTYKTHDVGCDERHAYEAAHSVLAAFGFHQVAGGPSQGFIEALNQVNPSGPNGVAKQTSLRVNFSVSTRVPGGTEVAALFQSIEDDPSNRQGGATTVPLAESPLYEVFFERLDARLASVKE